MRVILALLASLAMTACTLPAISPERAQIEEWEAGMSARFPDAATLRSFLAGKTYRIFGSRHGNQVEYFHQNGRAYLWYPGNRSAVPSLWTVREREDVRPGPGKLEICFLYGPRSYNPVTRRSGGQWECERAIFMMSKIIEIVPGDIFGLASGSIPSTLPKTPERSLAQLAGRPVAPTLLPSAPAIRKVYRIEMRQSIERSARRARNSSR